MARGDDGASPPRVPGGGSPASSRRTVSIRMRLPAKGCKAQGPSAEPESVQSLFHPSGPRRASVGCCCRGVGSRSRAHERAAGIQVAGVLGSGPRWDETHRTSALTLNSDPARTD